MMTISLQEVAILVLGFKNRRRLFQGAHWFSVLLSVGRNSRMHFPVVGQHQICQRMCVHLCSCDLGGGWNDLNLRILTLCPPSAFHRINMSLSSSLGSSSWDTYSWSLQLDVTPSHSEFFGYLWAVDIHFYGWQHWQWMRCVSTGPGLMGICA